MARQPERPLADGRCDRYRWYTQESLTTGSVSWPLENTIGSYSQGVYAVCNRLCLQTVKPTWIAENPQRFLSMRR